MRMGVGRQWGVRGEGGRESVLSGSEEEREGRGRTGVGLELGLGRFVEDVERLG
jgi:hypothetical protein